MRSFVTLIAVLSLVARWGDAACGCAAHHSWATSFECHHGHDHAPPASPVADHGCAGECEDAVYPISLRVMLPSAIVDPAPAGTGTHREFVFRGTGDAESAGGLPSRAMLGVYRI